MIGPRGRGKVPRMAPFPRGAGASLSLLILVLLAPAASAVNWLPGTTPAPILVADPYEPRMSVGVFPADDHVAATLGGLFPLVEITDGTVRVAISLEGAALLDLGQEGSLFPLETVDGVFGLRADAARDLVRVTVRARHWSAHRADGDSTIAYPPRAVSREFGTLEAGLHPGGFYMYARLGAAWHAVPEVSGVITALGLQWSASEGAWRPLVAAHWEDDPARGDRPAWSLFGGVVTGHAPMRLGLRWYQGPGPGGQHPERQVQRLGVELQIGPIAR